MGTKSESARLVAWLAGVYSPRNKKEEEAVSVSHTSHVTNSQLQYTVVSAKNKGQEEPEAKNKSQVKMEDLRCVFYGTSQ